MRRADQEVPQVTDRVVFDVVHESETPQRPFVQALVSKDGEVEIIPAQTIGSGLIRLDVEFHA
jgi:hypothetical protein